MIIFVFLLCCRRIKKRGAVGKKGGGGGGGGNLYTHTPAASRPLFRLTLIGTVRKMKCLHVGYQSDDPCSLLGHYK